MGTILEVRNLSVKYNNILALSNINISVNRNDFLAIIGPNGGGKSTFIKAIIGIVKPLEGTIKIFGKIPKKCEIPIGYVPQTSNFNKEFPISVIDVVLTGRLSNKGSLFCRYNSEDYKVVRSLMEELGILNLENRQIGQLSGGQLQKVLIARALATGPELLLLDEPTASVDRDSKTDIYKFLKSINKRVTIILVTHDTAAISSYIKSIACLNKELFYHGESELDNNIIQSTFGCPVDLIAHGVPHRVLRDH